MTTAEIRAVVPPDAFAGQTVVITGATGYIAQATARLLTKASCRLVRLSREPARLPYLAAASATLVAARWPLADFCSSADRRRAQGLLLEADVIFHFAAQTSATVAGQYPQADLSANVLPLLELLESLRGGGKRPAVVFAGTSTQVGMPQRQPVDERHPDRPVTVYDAHKLLCEHYLEHFTREGTVRGVSLRLTNVYGPGQEGGAADRGVLNRMVRRALGGDALTVYGDGAAIRDYIYIEDVAQAFLAAALYAETLSGGHFVIGSGQGHSLAQAFGLVAERVAALTGRALVAVLHVPPPADVDPITSRDFVADASSFAACTGWRPGVPLRLGIERTIQYNLATAGNNRP